VLQLLSNTGDHDTGSVKVQLRSSNLTDSQENISGNLEHISVAEHDTASEIVRCLPYLSGGRPFLTSNVSPVVQWGISIAWAKLKDRETAEAIWLRKLLRTNRHGFLAKGLFDEDARRLASVDSINT
jgi:hypothetical protein